MPIIDVTLVAGRTSEAKARLLQELTDATERSLGCPREKIRILIREVEPEHFSVGGLTKAEEAAAAVVEDVED